MFKPLSALLLIAAMLNGPAAAEASERWTSQQDPGFGFSFSYPEELFAALEGDRPSFHYFASDTSDAKFLVGAWDNRSGATPQEFKRWMLTNAEGYEEITYQPRGRSWFVVSGYRGDQIYYEKVMFSCGGNVVNVLAIAYPSARREVFDPVVERMENHFTPGRSCGS